MVDAFVLLVGAIVRFFHGRRRLLLENLALRQQLAVLKRRYPRPRLSAFDRFFWILARRFWSGWKQTLIIVGPETVVRWHRSGFALYWRAISKARRCGSPKLCAPVISTGYGVVVHRRNAVSLAHDRYYRTSGRVISSPFPQSSPAAP